MIAIRLNKELFHESVVMQCIRDYRALADFSVEESKDAFFVSLRGCRYDERETAKEFENYLIEQTYRCRLC